MNRKALLLIAALVIVCAFQSARMSEAGKARGRKVQIKVTSAVFHEGDMIPKRYTCDGANVSPPLAWTGVPQNTKSIAVLCDDPDAPMGTWVHWIMFNLPASARDLPEHVPTDLVLKSGAKQGAGDSGRIGYDGPCPPGGTHRYYFKVYALDRQLDLEPGVRKGPFAKAIEGHILAQGHLMGKYSRR
jgi:Raf kinase inhibitor-like YbhB/YbcL family protein